MKMAWNRDDFAAWFRHGMRDLAKIRTEFWTRFLDLKISPLSDRNHAGRKNLPIPSGRSMPKPCRVVGVFGRCRFGMVLAWFDPCRNHADGSHVGICTMLYWLFMAKKKQESKTWCQYITLELVLNLWILQECHVGISMNPPWKPSPVSTN